MAIQNIIEGYGGQFFDDQHVRARDLNTIEYSKTKIIRDYLKAITKTPGVVATDFATDDGLKVTTVADGSTFSVEAGTAIDVYGRIIHVPTTPLVASGSATTDPLYYPARPARETLSTGIAVAGTYYVNLRYNLMRGFPQYDDVGTMFYTRVYDSYTISVDSAAAADGIPLATMTLLNTGYIDVDSTGTGNNGRALYDARVLYTQHQGGIAELTTKVNNVETELQEVLDRSIGFQYPVDGDVFTTSLGRDAQIINTRLYMTTNDLASGRCDCTFSFGATPSTLTSIATVSVVSTDAWSDVSIPVTNGIYTAGDTIRFVLSQVTSNVKEVTAVIQYIRR